MNLVLSEVHPETAAEIGGAVSEWVHAENIESLNDRNAVFDNLDSMRFALALPFEDPKNMQAAKHISHENRQRQWGDDMIANPTDDYITGRHIFNILMQMSGVSKRLCYFKARDIDTYFELKTSPDIIGVDVSSAAQEYIDACQLQSGTFWVPDAAELQDRTNIDFQFIEQTFGVLRSRIPEDFGQSESPTVTMLERDQQRYAQLVTANVLSAMGYRDGSLEAVPFLEPKSISDEPQVIYPFAS